jgi:hypothetical protein
MHNKNRNYQKDKILIICKLKDKMGRTTKIKLTIIVDILQIQIKNYNKALKN